MVRATQLIHPPREPATLRSAATVLLARDLPDASGIEVLLTRRRSNASFAPGAFVFPGGGIEAADAEAHGLAARRATQSDTHLTQAIAAIRESFEELGVLLARHRSGSAITQADIAAMDRKAPFAPQCAALGLTLAADTVFVLAHWATDRDLPIRFDVPFLVARMPEGQTPEADEGEQFEPTWVKPADALARHAKGGFPMLFPTVRTLQRLAEWGSVDALLAACAGEVPLWNSCPRAGILRGETARFMEHESPYGELALTCPDGQIVHSLDWQTERPVALLKNVQRLTAPNAGAMTGPGTNSYLVGDAASGFIAIDPGPNEPAHLQRLYAAAGGDIRMIVCTHSHPDHSPGAAPLQAMCGVNSVSMRPPILGLPSASTARPSAWFAPDRTLQNQELLALEGRAFDADSSQKSDARSSHTLKVIHTPGHAANHLCLVLVEDGLLFSGDHILNGSTTVVDPPDGDMDQYLDSLDSLDAACAEHGIEYILPAHGYVLGHARDAIARLKAHRLKREEKVAAAMAARPEGQIADWVPLAYDDVPERMWPVAARSLAAHVARIRRIGRMTDVQESRLRD